MSTVSNEGGGRALLAAQGGGGVRATLAVGVAGPGSQATERVECGRGFRVECGRGVRVECGRDFRQQ